MVPARAVSTVDVSRLPEHVAIVMDGNGRWAQGRGCSRPAGHEEGAKAVRRVVRLARRLGIRGLTLYAFSEQNWARPAEEIEALMALLREFLVSERQEMLDTGIRLQPVGRIDKLPSSVREILDPLWEESAHLDGMVLTLCLSYGGREEIVDAARQLATEAADGQIDPESIDQQGFESRLPSMHLGPADLLIRTGGEQRLSNFLLWAAAYAELYFSPKLWPEYDEADFCEALAAYQKRERRFGQVLSDVEANGSLDGTSRRSAALA
jgi:undecaprenyl diphosphate synthase